MKDWGGEQEETKIYYYPYQLLQAGSCTTLIPVGFYQPMFELPP